MNDAANEIVTNHKKNNSKTTKSDFFEYKTKIVGISPADGDTIDTKVVVPLKCFSNFWRLLALLLINCEIELDLKWPKNWSISLISRTAAAVAANPSKVARPETTGVTFRVNLGSYFVYKR